MTNDQTPRVDISVPDLMNIIDQFGNARADLAMTGKGAQEAWSLRVRIERMLTQEKQERRAFEKLATLHARHKCQAKIGRPYHMRECGEPVEFLTAERAEAEGMRYSGWYHVDRAITEDHHAVTGIY